ncbi:hypothetical protein [Nitrososphaera sp.]|uniref:hypothetical protein n=1 Tax=Nitrososphaera sp. TaxID=1971748 RepID=UPI00307FCC78
MSQPPKIIWKVSEPDGFDKTFSKLDSDIQKSYLKKIDNILRSPDPRKFGVYERTRSAGRG